MNNQANFKDIFISYHSKDELFANKLYVALESKGISTWFAPNDIKLAMCYPSEIFPAIISCKIFVLIMSNSSVGKNKNDRGSKHVAIEISLAGDHQRVFAPIKIDKFLKRDNTSLVMYMNALSNYFDATVFPTDDERIIHSTNEIISILYNKPQSTHVSEISVNRQLNIINLIEENLSIGCWHMAKELLRANNFADIYEDIIQVKEVMCSLQQYQFMKNLPNHKARYIYNQLKSILSKNEKDFGALCWYLIANLSINYYHKNDLFDITEGHTIASQKYIDYPVLRIPTKYSLMMNYVTDIKSENIFI